MKGFVGMLFAAAALGLAVVGAHGQTAGSNAGQNPKSGEQGPPKTVGAMQNTVGNKATSAEDARRQTEGKPTMAEEAKQGGDKASHPGMTEHAPGTVGAAPGTTHPTGETARK